MREVIKNLTIRIPEDLHIKLVKLAELERRSMNGQVLAIIEDAVKNIATEPERQEKTAS